MAIIIGAVDDGEFRLLIIEYLGRVVFRTQLRKVKSNLNIKRYALLCTNELSTAIKIQHWTDLQVVPFNCRILKAN